MGAETLYKPIDHKFIIQLEKYLIDHNYTVSSGQLIRFSDISKALDIDRTTLQRRLNRKSFLENYYTIAIGYPIPKNKVRQIEARIKKEERDIQLDDFNAMNKFLGYNDGEYSYSTKIYRVNKNGKVIEPLFF